MSDPHARAIAILRAQADASEKELGAEPFHAGGFAWADEIKQLRAAADALSSVPEIGLTFDDGIRLTMKSIASFQHNLKEKGETGKAVAEFLIGLANNIHLLAEAEKLERGDGPSGSST